jgi:hypothetical protein
MVRAVRQRADSLDAAQYTYPPMAKLNQPPIAAAEQTLESLLDKVSNAREELVSVERDLERLRSDLAKIQKLKK